MRLFDMDSREDYLLDGKYKVATPYAPCVNVAEIVRCKDCKYFELDYFDRINGMPLIAAHEVCTKWSGGCKTSKDGFCFMGERRNNDNDRDTAEA